MATKKFLNKHINRFLGKHKGKDSLKKNVLKDSRVKKNFIRLPFIREISLQIKRKKNLFAPSLILKPNF